MKKRKNLKKEFVIVSAVFIFGLIFAYGTRFVHFYLEEKRENAAKEDVVTTNYFSDKLEDTINVVDASGGLYIAGNTFIYKYQAEANYLWYSGVLWRIVSINEDKTITIVSDKSISLLQPHADEDFLESYLEDFYAKLDSEFLTDFTYCADVVDDLKKITCENKVSTKISLLDMYAYNKSGSAKSYLNNGTIFWLESKTIDGDYWFVSSEGAVGMGTENVAHNIRPVVTLKAEINLVKGNGTKEDPYIIKKNEIKSLNSSHIGEYITYNDELWRILDVASDQVQALKVDCLREDDECVLQVFGKSPTYLNSTIYNYLNKTYLAKLENRDFLVKTQFYNGTYDNYDYRTLTKNMVEAYVGLPKIADYFISENLDSYLITPNVIDTIYTLSENGNYYLVDPSSKKLIYPILAFLGDLNVSGEGTINNPYVLSKAGA